LEAAKEFAPGTALHASTQTGIVSAATALAYCRLGFKRLILARELRLEEIKKIRAAIPSEVALEAFVHGAMCMAFSGRCLISEYLVSRSADRGDCAQPCRWSYSLQEESRLGEYFPVFEDERGTYILNSRDLCMIRHIPALMEAGVSSFKLEGRAKAPYYCGAVTSAYRRAIDAYAEHLAEGAEESYVLSEEIAGEVEKVSHRIYSTGFYLGGFPGQEISNGGYVRGYTLIGEVTGQSDNWLYFRLKNRLLQGDVLDLLRPRLPSLTITACAIRNGVGALTPLANHAEMLYSIPCSVTVSPGSFLRMKSN
jgi:putative protease